MAVVGIQSNRSLKRGRGARVQQVRPARCDGNREINESRGTLIGSELISNRDCDTINLSPLSAELHLSLSSFHAPLPLRLFSHTYALYLPCPSVVIWHLGLLHPLSLSPLWRVPCIARIYVHSQWIMYSCLSTSTHIYEVYSKN